MKKNNNKKPQQPTVYGKIVVTDHVIDRAILRRNIDINQLNQEQLLNVKKEIKESIVNQVKYSTLLKLVGNEEHRLHRGYIYVVKREYGIVGDTINIITVKLSNVQQKKNFSTDFSLETIDKKAMLADYSKVI